MRLRVPLAAALVDDDAALIELTEEQSRLLAKLSRTQRMAVTGCAGSGKTMLAVEHAKRLAAAGTKVLFVCFNKGLARHLSERERKSGVEFQTFHGLALHLAKKAGIKLPTFGFGEAPPDYWDVTLPEALIDAADILNPRYGALIVDEAQDLNDDWFTRLLYLLDDDAKAAVWLFFDDNQRIFDSGITPPDGYTRFDLTVNCRNTQAVHLEALQHYQGAIQPEVQGPLGRPVELHHTDDQPKTVAEVIEQLCVDGEVPPQDVVVLSGHGAEKSEVYKTLSCDYELSRKRGELGKKVYFSSIRGFKGLESPVVVLCELEELDEDFREQQLYVAISRARTHCAIVGAAKPNSSPRR